MLVCGQEEPLHVNEQVYALDEETGATTLSHVEDGRVNRYSFVWLGAPSEAAGAFTRLSQAIFERSHTTATWVLAWKAPDPDVSPARERWRLAKRRKEGWATHTDDTLMLALKPREPNDAGFEPPGYSWDDGELLLLLGAAPTLDVLANGPPRPSLITMTRRHRFAPSGQFFGWLADHQRTAVYRERDDLGHVAVIIVGTIKLDTAALHRQGIIHDLKIGADAEQVWRMS